MTKEVKADENQNEARQPPSSLTSYLKGGAPAARYIAAIGREVKIPDEEERFTALEMIAADSKLLPKVVELARALLDPSLSRARNALLPWVRDAIRARDQDLTQWARLADRSPDAEIADLAKRLHKARAGGDKDKVSEAEQVLLLGFAITSTRSDFDLPTALSSIHYGLSRDEDAEQVKRRAVKATATANLKHLNIFSAINHVVSAQLRKLTEEYNRVRQERDHANEKIRSLRDDIARLSAQVGELKDENDHAVRAVEALQVQLDGTKGGAAHDMIEARARFRRLLIGKLAPFVNDASLALAVDPPVHDIAKERLEQLKGEINKELEWLKQFSD